MSHNESYSKFPAMKTVLERAFPFLEDGFVLEIKPTQQTNLSEFHHKHIHTCSIGEDVNESFMIISSDKTLKIHKNKLQYVTRDRFEAAGYVVKKFDVVYKGQKDIQKMPDTWKENHLFIHFADSKDTSNENLIFLPWTLFSKALAVAGLGYIYEVNPKILQNKFQTIMKRLEHKLLISKNLLFFPAGILFTKMKPDEGALLINRLLKNKEIHEAFLASAALFFPKVRELCTRLPSKKKESITAYIKALKQFSAEKKELLLWKYQVDFVLTRVLSNYIYNPAPENPEIRTPGFDLKHLDGTVDKIRELRFIKRMHELPYQEIINGLIETKKVNALIKGGSRPVLAVMHLSGYPIPFDNLSKLFSNVFKIELNDLLKETKKTIAKKNVDPSAMRRFFTQNGEAFTDLIENAYMYNLFERPDSEDPAGIITKTAEILKSMDPYHFSTAVEKLSHFDIAALFLAFKYTDDSPLAGEKADAFVEDILKKLFLTDRTIIQSLYHEEINQNRQLSYNYLNTKLTQSFINLTFYKKLGYINFSYGEE